SRWKAKNGRSSMASLSAQRSMRSISRGARAARCSVAARNASRGRPLEWLSCSMIAAGSMRTPRSPIRSSSVLACMCRRQFAAVNSPQHSRRSMEIAASGLPRALAHLAVGLGQAGSAVAEALQVRREVDELVGDDMDDEALALDAAAHQEKLRGHHGA